jgi:hypothetical protein
MPNPAAATSTALSDAFERQISIGAARASEVGADIPDFAKDYFPAPELQQLLQIFELGHPSSKAPANSWTNIPMYSAMYWRDNPGTPQEFRSVVNKLVEGLERLKDERRVGDVNKLAEVLFPAAEAGTDNIPLDLAIARAIGYRPYANSDEQMIVGEAFLSKLANNPGSFLPHLPPRIDTPAALAKSLWGSADEQHPKDHIDLVSKLQHLAHFKRQLELERPMSFGELLNQIDKTREVLLHSVTHVSSSGLGEYQSLKALVELPELDETDVALSLTEKLSRREALSTGIADPPRRQLDRLYSELRAQADVSSQSTVLAKTRLGIDFAASRAIEKMVLEPLKVPAFCQGLAESGLTNVDIRKLEIGGLLFGTREPGNGLQIRRAEAYPVMRPTLDRGRPGLSYDPEAARLLIAKMEKKGLSFLGDWHVHPESATPLPSIHGDPLVYSKLRGGDFRFGETAVQLIVKVDNEKIRLYPYALVPFGNWREVEVPQTTRAIWQIAAPIADIPALYVAKELRVGKPSLLDKLGKVIERVRG